MEDEIRKYEMHRMKHPVWNEGAWNQKDQIAGMNWKRCKYTEWIIEYELVGMKLEGWKVLVWHEEYEFKGMKRWRW